MLFPFRIRLLPLRLGDWTRLTLEHSLSFLQNIAPSRWSEIDRVYGLKGGAKL